MSFPIIYFGYKHKSKQAIDDPGGYVNHVINIMAKTINLNKGIMRTLNYKNLSNCRFVAKPTTSSQCDEFKPRHCKYYHSLKMLQV